MRVSARPAKVVATVQVEALHVSIVKLDDGLQKGMSLVRYVKQEDGAPLKVRHQTKMHARKNVLEERTVLTVEHLLSLPVSIVQRENSPIRQECLLVSSANPGLFA